jgi:hypothetical protein
MMVKAKKLVVDAKTGAVREEEFDFTPPAPAPAPTAVSLEDLAKLVGYAKKQGWI